MSKALYRKYRPTTLSDVIGQAGVTTPLANALKSEKISHAYLFVGPRGCGKTSVARIFAHEINHFKYELEDNYVDIIEIDGASNRGIDDIRELREKVAIAPTEGKYKVYIIDEVHMLTREAFNALLKTLEEPPKHVVFIMATTDFYKVPVTITSRAQVFTFKLADTKTMFDHLKSICQKESIDIDDDVLSLIVQRGGGSFRDSLSLLDQIATLSDSKITRKILEESLGLPPENLILDLLQNYQNKDVVKITTLLKELISQNIKPETLAEVMISKIVAEPTPAFMSLLNELPKVQAPFAEAKLLSALLTNVCAKSMPPAQAAIQLSQTTTTVQSTPTLVEPAIITKTEIIAQSSPATNATTNNSFLEKLQSINSAIALIKNSFTFEISNNTLDIFPTTTLAKLKLSKDEMQKSLIEASGCSKVTIHEVVKKVADKISTPSQTSAIIDTEEMEEYGGEIPEFD